MVKKEFHVLIKYCFLKGKNTVEVKTWLDAKFPDTVPGKTTINDWYAKFRLAKLASKTVNAVDALKRLLPTKTLKKSPKWF
ncbi:hypothetical protein GWI33_021885 [Rhynchophorus ferrugineus]|uniref:Mos1 transposase HTH domain-containing protein n=1 Tax=Rhynchophorus ferrugineus TaxID=354439 RepID=A0A834IVD4_RHYFE|nr:hypothetical protein GWI33_021885 [Rhynchophorus ferrugineus]